MYKAEDTHLERIIALKTILPSLASSESTVQRFLREAKANAKMRHDNIVTLYDCGKETANVDELVFFADKIHSALKNDKVYFNIETI